MWSSITSVSSLCRSFLVWHEGTQLDHSTYFSVSQTVYFPFHLRSLSSEGFNPSYFIPFQRSLWSPQENQFPLPWGPVDDTWNLYESKLWFIKENMTVRVQYSHPSDTFWMPFMSVCRGLPALPSFHQTHVPSFIPQMCIEYLKHWALF